MIKETEFNLGLAKLNGNRRKREYFEHVLMLLRKEKENHGK